MLKLTYDLTTIDAAAERFWKFAGSARVILFSGTLGAGKTTFIAALARHLQVKDAVSSPTFSLINSYRCPKDAAGFETILHMDWYRLRDEEEAVHSGLEDALLDESARAWVEWPEKAAGLLPADCIHVRLEALSETERLLRAEIGPIV